MPFSLIGTLGLDTSPYEAALSKSERTALQSRARIIQGSRDDSMNPFTANNFHGVAAKAGGEVAKSFGQKFKEGIHAENFGQFLTGNFSSVLTAGAGALGLGAGFMVTSHLAQEYQKEVKDARIGAARTGLSVERFQQVSKTLDANGSSVGDFSSALDRVAKAQRDIRENVAENGPETPGSAKSMRALATFGITEEDAKAKDFRDLLFDIGKAFQYAGKPTAEMVAALKDLRISPDLIPALQKGFDSARAKAGNISEEEVAMEKARKKITEDSDAFWANIGHGVMKAASGIYEGAKFIGPWAAKGLWEMLTGADTDSAKGAKNMQQIVDKQRQEAKAAAAVAEARAKDEERNTDATIAYAAELEEQDRVQNTEQEAELRARNDREQKQTELKSLSTADRRKSLEADRARLEAELQALNNQPFDFSAPDAKNKFAAHMLAIQKKRGEVLDIDKQLAEGPTTPTVKADTRLDSLSKIGGFGNAADAGMRQEFAKHTGLLEKIERNTKSRGYDPLRR